MGQRTEWPGMDVQDHLGERIGREARFEFRVIGLLFGLKCPVGNSKKMEERSKCSYIGNKTMGIRPSPSCTASAGPNQPTPA